MCFVAFPSSPLVTSKRINFHRNTRARDATSSLLSSVHTYFHGSPPKGFLSFFRIHYGRSDEDAGGRGRAGRGRDQEGKEGGANGNGTTTSTGEEKKQKRRRGGGRHYSDYVDCPAGRCRLPSKAPRECVQRGCVTSPSGVLHSVARAVPFHRRARLLQSVSLRAPGRSRPRR